MYSFCIITDKQEPAKLNALINSIRSQKLRDGEYEIIVTVDNERHGRLGLLRNTACRQARGEVLVVLDDDMLLHPDFIPGLRRYGDDFDVLSCRILNPDYTRFWDWKAYENGKNWLLDYGDCDPNQSLTGGLTIMKREVFDRVQWDEQRGFYQEEDVDFTRRVKSKGFRVEFNPWSTVTHDAPYTQHLCAVVRTDGK